MCATLSDAEARTAVGVSDAGAPVQKHDSGGTCVWMVFGEGRVHTVALGDAGVEIDPAQFRAGADEYAARTHGKKANVSGAGDDGVAVFKQRTAYLHARKGNRPFGVLLVNPIGDEESQKSRMAHVGRKLGEKMRSTKKAD